MPGPYIVLATDYNRFSLVYSCRNENGQKAGMYHDINTATAYIIHV